MYCNAIIEAFGRNFFVFRSVCTCRCVFVFREVFWVARNLSSRDTEKPDVAICDPLVSISRISPGSYSCDLSTRISTSDPFLRSVLHLCPFAVRETFAPMSLLLKLHQPGSCELWNRASVYRQASCKVVSKDDTGNFQCR